MGKGLPQQGRSTRYYCPLPLEGGYRGHDERGDHRGYLGGESSHDRPSFLGNQSHRRWRWCLPQHCQGQL